MNSYTCRRCHTRFESRKTLWRHRRLEHGVDDETRLHPDPWIEQKKKPWTDDEGNIVDDELRDIYMVNRDIILKTYDNGEKKIKNTYNFPVSQHDIDFRRYMNIIFEDRKHSFKINAAFGFILQHLLSGEYRFFIPYNNVHIFERPRLVSNASDLNRVIQDVEVLSLEDSLMRQRPNTKWIPVLVTNVTFEVFSTNFTLGDGSSNLPRWLKTRQGVKILSSKNDNLCFFRCLAFHQRNNDKIKKLTSRHFKKWCHFRNLDETKEFLGVIVPDQLPELEELFQTNVNVFYKDELIDVIIPLYLSSACRKLYRNFPTEMNLFQFENHLSYINNFEQFARKFKCRNCEKCFNSLHQIKRHERSSCWKRTIFKHPGGYYSPPRSIFQRLQDVAEIEVEVEDRLFEWFIMFDFEALLIHTHTGEAQSSNTRWSREHRAVSVSICSNVPGFTIAECIVDEDPSRLVRLMLSKMQRITREAQQLAKRKLQSVFQELDRQIEFWSIASEPNEEPSVGMLNRLSKPNVFRSMIANLEMNDEVSTSFNDWEELDDLEVEGDGEQSTQNGAVKMRNTLSRLRKALLSYCSQIPVLGFNSGNYDLNLIKDHLASLFATDSTAFILKKNNQYTTISNENFRFLDVSQYLPPGTSYEQFLKTFGVRESKGFFCFEYLDSFAKLAESELPPMAAFWSSLRSKNTLEDDKFADFAKLCEENPTKLPLDVARELGLNSVPRSKAENYELLRQTWREEGMTTLKDLLVYYNNKDVRPGIIAISRLRDFFFREMMVDIFKTAVSAPGVARQILFRSASQGFHAFASFDETNRDLYETIQANIVGGPSIIFCRHQKANETLIRKNVAKMCRSCVGYDANALYVYCLSLPMPVSYFVRWQRKKTDAFEKDRPEKYTIAYDWLDWISKRDGLRILHKLNSGRESSVGPYFLDGFAELPVKTAFEFLGCYWHQHPSDSCSIYSRKDEKRDRYTRTIERERFIRKRGYKYVSIWECEFKKMCATDYNLQQFISERCRNRKNSLSELEILHGVRNETFFGMVEVDIHVPDELYEHFSEMSPIFVTTKVSFKDIGTHMQNYVKSRDGSIGDRTLLIGGMRATRVLLATPLLCWYLKNGLVVSRIYQAVEFGRARCFKTFSDMITDARRLGDVHTEKKVLADLNKLIGNSAFGGLLMQKQRHRSCSFVQGIHSAKLRVNTPQFISLTSLSNETFEILSAKKRTTLDLPCQIGYFVLQYAKLRMLEFYFDFLCVFIDRSDFQLCQMDTDSLYFAISGETLYDVVRTEKKDAFNHLVKGFCDREDIDARYHFLPRTCCDIHARRDTRTPGLFKLECSGRELVSLNSKTYALRIDDQKEKMSSKGLNKLRISNATDTYNRVLTDKESRCVVNSGFRARSNTMYTYEQKRWGMTYFYCKRIVQDDGVSTEPLAMELYPAKLNN